MKTTGVHARGLSKLWSARSPWAQASIALDNLDLDIPRGKTFGLVGESGSGKSTLALGLLGLLKLDAGEIWVEGNAIHQLKGKALRRQRQRMQIIFQNPLAALDPRQTVGAAILEPLHLHRLGSPIHRRQQLQNMLEIVGLSRSQALRFPHQLSGGQQQRVMIARALICRPDFLVADEPVSALDAPIQAQILNLLRDLQAELGFTMLLISHELPVIQFMADRVGVMFAGQLLEVGDNAAIFGNPCHPYTEALLAAAGAGQHRISRHKQPINTAPSRQEKNSPNCCCYLADCTRAVPACKQKQPKSTFINKTAAHWVKCLHYE